MIQRINTWGIGTRAWGAASSPGDCCGGWVGRTNAAHSVIFGSQEALRHDSASQPVLCASVMLSLKTPRQYLLDSPFRRHEAAPPPPSPPWSLSHHCSRLFGPLSHSPASSPTKAGWPIVAGAGNGRLQ